MRSASPGTTPARPLVGIALALACLLAANTPAWAQYKWKDSRGQVHVSDLPPPRDIPDKDVLQRPNPVQRPLPAPVAAAGSAASAPAPGLAAKPALDPELEARRKKAELETKAKAQAEEERAAAVRAENCQRARQQLATLDNGQRLVQFNAKGERVVMDDNARAAAAAQARQVASTDCR